METIEFAHRMNYHRLGFVFCIGLTKEAKVIENLLSAEGFEKVSRNVNMVRTCPML